MIAAAVDEHQEQLDLVVLPELFAYNPYATLEGSAEVVARTNRGADAPTNRVSDAQPHTPPHAVLPHCRQWAREFACYVVCPLVERVGVGSSGRSSREEEGGEREAGGVLYNAAVLVDRAGGVVGIYRKTFPTYGSYEEGGIWPSPQELPAVFDTDFGRLGILLCFDVNFSELWAHFDTLQSRADVVVFPSAMAGSRLLQAYATIHNYYIVENGDRGTFFDIDGSQMTPVYDSHRGVRIAVLDLDRTLVHTTDPHNGGKHHVQNMLRHPDVAGKLQVEKELLDVDMWLLRSVHQEMSVRHEMESLGLQDVRTYRNRARAIINYLRLHALPSPGLYEDIDHIIDHKDIIHHTTPLHRPNPPSPPTRPQTSTPTAGRQARGGDALNGGDEQRGQDDAADCACVLGQDACLEAGVQAAISVSRMSRGWHADSGTGASGAASGGEWCCPWPRCAQRLSALFFPERSPGENEGPEEDAESEQIHVQEHDVLRPGDELVERQLGRAQVAEKQGEFASGSQDVHGAPPREQGQQAAGAGRMQHTMQHTMQELLGLPSDFPASRYLAPPLHPAQAGAEDQEREQECAPRNSDGNAEEHRESHSDGTQSCDWQQRFNVTVVLNPWHRPSLLRSQLGAIAAQSFGVAQVWVVMSASPQYQELRLEVERTCGALPSLRCHEIATDYNFVYYLPWQVALQATTRYVWFLDDDVLPGPCALAYLLHVANTGPYRNALLGGRGTCVWPGVVPVRLCRPALFARSLLFAPSLLPAQSKRPVRAKREKRVCVGDDGTMGDDGSLRGPAPFLMWCVQRVCRDAVAHRLAGDERQDVP